jgi:hypothetical protein
MSKGIMVHHHLFMRLEKGTIMTLHVIGIIANFKAYPRCKFIAQRILLRSFFARYIEDVVVKRMLSRRACCCAKYVVAHWMLLHRGFYRVVDFVALWMLSHIGCCHAEDVIVQWISLCIGCCRVEDVITQWISLRSGYCHA